MNYFDRLNYFYNSQHALISAMLFVMTGVSISESVHAVDPSQLWLPRGYNRYTKELTQAADLAETTMRCQKVIAGTVSTQHSNKEHPVFKIICRDENRKTFPWLIDGKTMNIINKPKGQKDIVFKESVVEERKEEGTDVDINIEVKEKVEVEAEARVDDLPKAVANDEMTNKDVVKKEEPSSYQKEIWAACSYHLRERVKNFRNLSLDTQVMPQPIELINKGLLFEIDFKAQRKEIEEDVREELLYTAKCQYQDKKYALEVYPTEDMPRVAQSNNRATANKKDHVNKKGRADDESDLVSSPAEKNTSSQRSEPVLGTISDAVSEPLKIKMGNNVVDACIDQLKRKTAALDQVVWLTEKSDVNSQSIDSRKGSQALAIDFDAVGPSGRKLKSTGFCYFDNDEIRIEVQNRETD